MQPTAESTHETSTELIAAPPAVGRLARLRARSSELASEVGQGTVEYVGLLLLMATLLAAVVAAAGSLGGKEKIGGKVVEQIGNSIDKAGGGGGK